LASSSESSQERRQRLNKELADVAKHLGLIGPRINEVARLSHQHKESVRYRYRRFFVTKGITIQATPNFAKLGITRLIIFAKLAPELENQAVTIFTFMNEACYLRSFTRVLPSHEYIIHVAVPKSLRNQCSDVFMRFHEAGLFTEL